MHAVMHNNLIADREMEEMGITDEQRELTPGTLGILTNLHSLIDHDLTLAIIQEITDDVKARYPDYEQRVARNYVYCHWISLADPEPTYGWFHRSRFMKIDQDRYDEVRGWISGEDLPEKHPQWLVDLVDSHAETLNPFPEGTTIQTVTCGNCGSENVEMHAKKTTRVVSKVAMNDKGEYYTKGRPDFHETVTAHLHCKDCDCGLEIDEAGSLYIQVVGHDGHSH